MSDTKMLQFHDRLCGESMLNCISISKLGTLSTYSQLNHSYKLPFIPLFSFYPPWKHIFSDVLRGYKKGPVAWSEFKKSFWFLAE